LRTWEGATYGASIVQIHSESCPCIVKVPPLTMDESLIYGVDSQAVPCQSTTMPSDAWFSQKSNVRKIYQHKSGTAWNWMAKNIRPRNFFYWSGLRIDEIRTPTCDDHYSHVIKCDDEIKIRKASLKVSYPSGRCFIESNDIALPVDWRVASTYHDR